MIAQVPVLDPISSEDDSEQFFDDIGYLAERINELLAKRNQGEDISDLEVRVRKTLNNVAYIYR